MNFSDCDAAVEDFTRTIELDSTDIDAYVACGETFTANSGIGTMP